jgi:hypothetical protein
LLAGELDDVRGGVVAGSGEFDEFGDLDGGETVGRVGKVGGRELADDFVGGGVEFAEVGCVAETEGGCGCWGCEGLCEVCDC